MLNSIKENIKFGATKATDEEVVTYAKAAVVHQNIKDFKQIKVK
mgnify:CR=1 FL=1